MAHDSKAVAALRTEWERINDSEDGVTDEFVERLLAALEAPQESTNYDESAVARAALAGIDLARRGEARPLDKILKVMRDRSLPDDVVLSEIQDYLTIAGYDVPLRTYDYRPAVAALPRLEAATVRLREYVAALGAPHEAITTTEQLAVAMDASIRFNALLDDLVGAVLEAGPSPQSYCTTHQTHAVRLADLQWMIGNCRTCNGDGTISHYDELGSDREPISCPSCTDLRCEYTILTNILLDK